LLVAFHLKGCIEEAQDLLKKAVKSSEDLIINKENRGSNVINDIKSKLIHTFIRTENIKGAMNLISEMKNTENYSAIGILGKIAVALYHSENRKEADELLEDIMDYILNRNIEPPWFHIYILCNVANSLVQIRRNKEAEELVEKARQINGNVAPYQAKSFKFIAISLAKLGKYDEAKKMTSFIYSDGDYAEVLKNITFYFLRDACLDEAITLAENIPEDSVKASAFSYAAMQLAENGQLNKANTILEKALNLEAVVQAVQKRDAALNMLSGVIARTGNLEAATTLVYRIDDSWEKDKAINELLPIFCTQNAIDKAHDLIKLIELKSYRISALCNFGIMMLVNNQKDKANAIIKEAKKVSQKIESKWDRGKALYAIIQYLMVSEQTDHALELSNNIEDEMFRAGTLVFIAKFMSQYEDKKKHSIRILNEALAVSRTIEAGGLQVKAQCDIAAAFKEFGFESKSFQIMDEAKRVAHSIPEQKIRANVLGVFASTLDHLKRKEEADSALDEALKITQNIKSDWNWDGTIPEGLSNNLAKSGRFKQMFSLISLKYIDELVEFLAKQSCSFENIEPGLSLKVLKEATHIAGWVRDDWRDISKEF